MVRIAILAIAVTACSANLIPEPAGSGAVAAGSDDCPVEAPAIEPPVDPASLDPGLPSDLDELDDPHPSVFRDTRLGGMRHPSRETSILRRAGDRASLRVIIERDARDRSCCSAAVARRPSPSPRR
jgi:hypothetical protein